MNGELWLSPSLDELVRRPEVPDDLNRPWVVGYVYERWTSIDETFFSAIRRLPPGHALHRSRGAIATFRYWDPDELAGDELPESEAVERIEALAWQAVDRCLAGEPAGVFLSGGLDSAAVAALAADVARRRGLPAPVGLSVVFPPPADEEWLQRQIAERLALPHVLASLARRGDVQGLLFTALESAVDSALPPARPWGPRYDWLVGEGVQRGCRVVLTGHGGDDWFFPLEYAADLTRSLDLGGLYAFWRAYRGYYARSRSGSARLVLWQLGLRPVFLRLARRAAQGLAPQSVRTHRRRELADALPRWLAADPALRSAVTDRWLAFEPSLSTAGFAEQARRSTLEDWANVHLLEYEFLHGRDLGVRMEQPFFDLDLVELVFRVPFGLHSRNGQAKWAARKILEHRLPDLARAWPRTVTGGPAMRDILAAQAAAAWRSAGGAPLLATAGIVDSSLEPEDVDRLCRAGTRNERAAIFHILALDNWLRSRRIGAPKEVAASGNQSAA